MLETVNEVLQAKGLMLKVGSAVDAMLIAAPNSTNSSRLEATRLRLNAIK